MHTLIENKREKVAELCRRHRVKRLAVFGSAADDTFDASHSDVDLVVEFEPMPPIEHGAAYWALREALQEMFGRPIDLIERQTIKNPYLQEQVRRSQVPLYDAA